jgi:multiple sugar transport system substrate-binding protein
MAGSLRTILGALAVACVLALAGCGGDDDSGGGGGGGVSFQLFGDPEELAVYRDLAEAYEEETGDEVNLIEVADREAHYQKLTTSFAGGKPPDLFLVNYRNYGGYADRKVLDPVGPRLDKSKTLDRDAFYPEPIEAFTFDGELQCMPQNVSSLVVYFNRTIFREAQLPDPAPDWTYDDMVETAETLTSVPARYGLGVEPGVVRVAPFVWSAGGELVDDYSNPTKFTLDTPEGRAGLQAFLDLAEVGPNEQDVAARPLEERFLDGELAMFMSSRREVPVFRTIKDFDWDVAPFPRLSEKAGVLHSDAYCISKGARADAAWRFVEFATGAEGQRIASEGGRTVPSLKEVANSDAYLDPDSDPKGDQVFLDAVPTIRRLPNSPNWPALEDGADFAFEEAFYLGYTMDELFDRLALETDGKF